MLNKYQISLCFIPCNIIMFRPSLSFLLPRLSHPYVPHQLHLYPHAHAHHYWIINMKFLLSSPLPSLLLALIILIVIKLPRPSSVSYRYYHHVNSLLYSLRSITIHIIKTISISYHSSRQHHHLSPYSSFSSFFSISSFSHHHHHHHHNLHTRNRLHFSV